MKRILTILGVSGVAVMAGMSASSAEGLATGGSCVPNYFAISRDGNVNLQPNPLTNSIPFNVVLNNPELAKGKWDVHAFVNGRQAVGYRGPYFKGNYHATIPGFFVTPASVVAISGSVVHTYANPANGHLMTVTTQFGASCTMPVDWNQPPPKPKPGQGKRPGRGSSKKKR